MLDLNQFADVGALGVFVMALVQVLKARMPKQDVPYLALALGVALSLLVGFGLGKITEPVGIVVWIFTGLGAGLGAIGAYQATIDRMTPPKLPRKDPLSEYLQAITQLFAVAFRPADVTAPAPPDQPKDTGAASA